MDLIKRKNRLVALFEKIDDVDVIEKLEAFFKKQEKEKSAVAYTINGKSISKKEYIENNKVAEQSYLNGNYKTQQEILEKYKN